MDAEADVGGEDVDLVPEYAPALDPDGNGNGWKRE